MVLYVVNVRLSQLDPTNDCLHLPRFSLAAALHAAGNEILMFAARDEDKRGYFGTATLGDPMPDLTDKSKYRLPLYNQRHLDRVITLAELRALGIEELPFHAYSRPIRPIFEQEQNGLITLGAIPAGFGDGEAQTFQGFDTQTAKLVSSSFRQLRFEMYDAYKLACAFTRRPYQSLDGHRYGFDVGHLWPHYAGGPSIIQNAIPMSKDVNNQWDEGMVSLTNAGNLLLAKNAGADTRALFAGFKRIEFPEDPQLWPDIQFLERHRDEIFEQGPRWISQRS